MENLIRIVSQHSDYLQLHTEGEEVFLDVRYGNTPYTFIMNEDRMFKVGNQLYKVFDDCIVITGEGNFYELQVLTEDGLKGIGDNNDYIIEPIVGADLSSESTNDSYLKKITEIQNNGKERVRATMECCILGLVQNTGNGVRTTVGLTFKTQGYRKFVCYWPVKRTLTHHISGSMFFEGDEYSGSDISSSFGYSKVVLLVSKTKYLNQYCNDPVFGIVAANGYGRTPAVKAVFNYHH